MEERKPTYEELLAENIQLKQLVEQLLLRIDKLETMLWGKKSEKSKKNQVNESKQTTSSDNPNESQPKRTREKNGGGGRNSFPPNIPRQDIPISLHPDECRCPQCGKEYESMGVEITEVLHYVPMVLTVLRFIRERKKTTCDCNTQKITIAEMPIRNLDKGSVTTEFIAAVLVNKYCDHLPVHRQVERLFKTSGVKPSESSVCRWRDVIAEQLSSLVELMKERIKQSCCINTDATTAPCRLPKEQNRLVNGNQYVYIGNDDASYNVFDFQINQSAKGMLSFLEGYQGFIQCDAHGNYDKLFSPPILDESKPPPLEVGCHAHCRRKFKDAEKYEPDDSKRVLNLYKKLYKIEAEIQGLSQKERLFRRQAESVPLLNELFDTCRAIQSASLFLPKSPLGQAVAYALKNEMALRRYCAKSFLNIDNNVSERALRTFVVGRKNWLFFGSEQAAKNSAVIMSVLSSARRHGLNEWEYLVDILYRLSDLHSASELEFLLPDRWVKSAVPPTEAAALISAATAAKWGAT